MGIGFIGNLRGQGANRKTIPDGPKSHLINVICFRDQLEQAIILPQNKDSGHQD